MTNLNFDLSHFANAQANNYDNSEAIELASELMNQKKPFTISFYRNKDAKFCIWIEDASNSPIQTEPFHIEVGTKSQLLAVLNYVITGKPQTLSTEECETNLIGDVEFAVFKRLVSMKLQTILKPKHLTKKKEYLLAHTIARNGIVKFMLNREEAMRFLQNPNGAEAAAKDIPAAEAAKAAEAAEAVEAAEAAEEKAAADSIIDETNSDVDDSVINSKND